MTTTKIKNRKRAILAMEYLARCINDETVFEPWLICGVADGDIPLGSFDTEYVDDWYIEDENFGEICELFTRLMARANKSGGLYCD